MVSKPEQIKTEQLGASKPDASKLGLVIIKKYANRRLYNTETSSYVTLDDIAQMVRSDREFHVFDAKSGDDLTHSVLTQIIVEQEGRTGGPALLPIPFLRQLIRFYDDSLARMVPSYLQMSLDTLMKEQDRFRSQFGSTWAGHAFETYQDQARRNLVLFEQAMKMWTPFGPLPMLSSDPYHATVVPPAGTEKQAAQAAGPAPAQTTGQTPGQTPGAPAGPIQVAGQQPAPARDAAAAPHVNGKPAATPPARTGEPVRDDLADMRAQLAAMHAQIEKMARNRQ